jgi:RHS repeat-associated protein
MNSFAWMAFVVAVVAPATAVAQTRPAHPSTGHLGFTGEWHSADGTVYLRNRVYHPRLRRFLQRDVVAGVSVAPMTLNRYTYVEGNPATWTDPTGLQAQKDADDRPFWETWRGWRDAVAGAGAERMNDIIPWPFRDAYMRALRDRQRKFGINVDGDNYHDGGNILNRAVDIATTLATLGRSALKGTGGKPCSFDASTEVETPSGPRPIAAVRAGDEVLAQDADTGEISIRRVFETFATPDEEVVALDVRTAAGKRETIRTTANHPFHVQGRGFVNAASLRPGEDLLTAASGFVHVESLRSIGRGTMHNLDVDGPDTFFVGASRVLVHNCDPTIGSLGRAAQESPDLAKNKALYVHDQFFHAHVGTLRSGAGLTEMGEALVIGADEVVRARAVGATPNVDSVMHRLKPHLMLHERKTGVVISRTNIENVLASYDRKLARFAELNKTTVQEMAESLRIHVRGSVGGKPIPETVLKYKVPIGPF